MARPYFIQIDLNHQADGCSHARCTTPEASGFVVQDNTGVRKSMCIHCLTALLEAVLPEPQAVAVE